MKKIFIQSLGCRASQADGAAIQASLEERGFSATHEPAAADLVVVNTCTVTHSADIDARRIIRGLHRDHPRAEIVVTGCYAQRAPGELAEIEGVRWVIDNSQKSRIAEIVSAAAEDHHSQVHLGDVAAQRAFTAAPVGGCCEDRTRPNLKVQDGCSNRCAFCIIPEVRGPSRSATLESVIAQVRDLASRYGEVVLTGINLGRWGRDLQPPLRFAGLLREILDRTAIRRLRISSVEPMDWSDELFHLMASEPRIATHVHMPLQSGSDAILKRMYRKYRTRHYASRLELASRLLPDAAIGADVMTGFPGETDTDFQQTLDFIDQQPFTYLHVFTYSERPGTRASELAGRVAVEIRRERTRVLRDLSSKKHLAFRRRMIGKSLSAVTLEQRMSAVTSNYLTVALAVPRDPHQIVDLSIDGISETGLRERNRLAILP
ncbi:MAG: tRNA (N(6)-L-threonylcarbamoyladenosine(37)-C(2))-methylthiotransferase MtaB [Acidobacteriaceae bacterium]|nr:tRNA (N(6)-L-threonylcarbamoyladenosine(37)-C(2))-methylthiotransferase MtaB [Acidobacteriaceae bacterium]